MDLLSVTAMGDRVHAFLAHANIVDALQEEDVAEILSDVASLSEEYIPTLQFLMRPDNRTSICFSPLGDLD